MVICMELDKSKYAAAYQSEIERQFTPQETALIWDQARSGYQKLLAAYPDLPPKVAAHTDGVIFPAIAVYRALLESCPERAMEIMEQGMAQRAARVGKTYARLVSLPGMKGVFLKLFSKGAKSGFGEKSGFGQEFLTDSSRELAFNIIKCPYWDLCTVLGCP